MAKKKKGTNPNVATFKEVQRIAKTLKDKKPTLKHKDAISKAWKQIKKK